MPLGVRFSGTRSPQRRHPAPAGRPVGHGQAAIAEPSTGRRGSIKSAVVVCAQALACAGSILALGGCASKLATPEFTEMSSRYARNIEQYTIDMLFTNVIRASLDYPLTFLDIPNINGSGNVTTSPSLNASLVGSSAGNLFGTLGSISVNAGTSLGKSFNFSQVSLDNAVFWKSFLAQIPNDTIKYFFHNRMPKEVVLSLIVEEIIITGADGSVQRFSNNPLQPHHAAFQRELYRLIRSGMTVQSAAYEQRVGNVLTEKELEKTYGTAPEVTLSRQGMIMRKVGELAESPKAQDPAPATAPGKAQSLYEVMKLTAVERFCIPRGEDADFVARNYGEDMFCDAHLGENDLAAGRSKRPRVEWVQRSTKNIYEYLGEVVAAQLADPPYLVTLPPVDSGSFNKKSRESRSNVLFLVERNASGAKVFSSVEAPDDNKYSIPSADNGYSTMVIGLLAQLQTLLKIPGSVPSSPAVLIQ